MQRAIESQLPLTMCPLSNFKLCAVPSLEQHRLKKLLDKGLCVTINSDDPAYWGDYLAENYIQSAKALGLSRKNLYQLAKNSFTACLISDEQCQAYYRLLEQFEKNFNE